MDRLMRHVGLPGKAFVPLLSAHACAIPAIMASRVIEDKRDRLVTILVAPLMSCSARIPVYSMLAALLFARDPWRASLVFTGAYLLGIIAALAAALVFKRTILRGETRPLVLELPAYKWPSLRTAVLTMVDRALVFIKNAGTVILLISIVLWALATYPKGAPPPEAVAMQEQVASLTSPAAEELQTKVDRLISHHALSNSVAGRIGRFVEPVIRPLGFDWQIGIGIISSFAATRSDRLDASRCLRCGGRRCEGKPAIFVRLAPARRAVGRIEGVHHRDLRELIDLLRPGRAVSFDAGRHAPRDEQLEVASPATRVHERNGLRGRARGLSGTSGARRPVTRPVFQRGDQGELC